MDIHEKLLSAVEDLIIEQFAEENKAGIEPELGKTLDEYGDSIEKWVRLELEKHQP